MLLRIARLTKASASNVTAKLQYSYVQQHNTYTTGNQKGTLILLKYHYMPENSYCSVLYLALTNTKNNI